MQLKGSHQRINTQSFKPVDTICLYTRIINLKTHGLKHIDDRKELTVANYAPATLNLNKT